MDSFTLNAAQRAALQVAIARRAKAARLEHYRRQAELAATPDYFQHQEHAARFARDLRSWIDRQPRMTVPPLGYDPRDNNWQAHLRAAVG